MLKEKGIHILQLQLKTITIITNVTIEIKEKMMEKSSCDASKNGSECDSKSRDVRY